MRHFHQERFRHQVPFLRRQFLPDGDLPFTDVLTEELLSSDLSGLGASHHASSCRIANKAQVAAVLGGLAVQSSWVFKASARSGVKSPRQPAAGRPTD